jgi:hypothetical protein
MAKLLQVLFLLLISNFTFDMNCYCQSNKKPYFENTFSPLNIIPQPGPGLKSEYWVGSVMNSIMIKAGLNSKHVFRFGYSTYGSISHITMVLNDKNSNYYLYGDEFRFGYQYNFKKIDRRTIPFVAADIVYSDYREENRKIENTKNYNRTINKGFLINLGLKQKIWTVIVLNIESGFFVGKTKSTHTLSFYSSSILNPIHNYSKAENQKLTFQFYPIKIGLGVRIGDYKRKI